jgi:5-methylcytosine-specific restriction enzyme subunit McrC
MKAKPITVREAYDWITEEAVTPDVFAQLTEYVRGKYPDEEIVEYGHRRLRFVNYVGVLHIAGVTIEILPKIALSPEDNRRALLSMLRHAGYFSISFFDRVANGQGRDSLLDSFLAAYVHRLQEELQRGIDRSYVEQTENRNALRGKVLVTEHLRQNSFVKTRVMCRFDEHSENQLLNQVLKAALRIAQKRIGSRLPLQVERCLALMDGVEDREVRRDELSRVQLNRQNERFRDALLFAQLILERASIHHQGDDGQAFSFLFEMNKLFEAYIGVALQEVLGPGRVYSQHEGKKLLLNTKTNRMNIQLRPDFVTADGHTILDTKWKSGTVQGRLAYQQSDLYQMYAYVTAYKDATRCILLYPYQEEYDYPVWQVIDTSKTIEMASVRLDDYESTKADLVKIFSQTSAKL